MTPYRIATLTRKACDLHNAITKSFDSDLNGMCAVASHSLYLNLKAAGIESEFIVGTFGFGSHCWIKTADDLHLDITATQFRGDNPKVLKWKSDELSSNVPLLETYGSWGNKFDYLRTGSESGIIKLIRGWHAPQGITKKVTRELSAIYESIK